MGSDFLRRLLFQIVSVLLDFAVAMGYNIFEQCSKAETMDNNREAIIRATIALIEEKGENTDAITMREICKKAEVGLGLINYYFENKDKLMDLCVEKIINGTVDKFNTIREQTKERTPYEKLECLGNMTMSFLFDHYNVAKISILTDMRAPKENDNTHRTYLAFLPLVAACRPDWDSDRIKRATYCLVTAMQQAFLRQEIILLTQGVNLLNAEERKAYHSEMIKDILGVQR